MGRKDDAFRGPSRRIVQQWLRHLKKVREAVRGAGGKKPVLRLQLRAENVSRFLTVSDGDGFVAAGLRIRLLGMDAPEIDQTCMDAEGNAWPCGKRARWRLFELLSGKELEVEVHDVDRYGRMLSVCRANGVDVAEVMVREGLAICYCSKRYAQAQQEAVRAKRGIWRGSFQEPATWRQASRQSDRLPSSSAGKDRGWQPAGKNTGRAHESRKVLVLRDQCHKEARDARRDTVPREQADAILHDWQQLRTALDVLLSRMRG